MEYQRRFLDALDHSDGGPFDMKSCARLRFTSPDTLR